MNEGRRSRVVWAVAGFDPSSGAGVTADLQTFAAHGLFGCSVITALTVQNTVSVAAWEPVAVELFAASLRHLSLDLPPSGVKVGMLGTEAIAGALAVFLRELSDAGGGFTVVLDPVLRSSSGRELFPAAGLPLLHEAVLPRVDWVTPNRGELAVLTGETVRSLDEVRMAARKLQRRHPQLGIVTTGGDEAVPTDHVLEPGGAEHVLRGRHVETRSTHGTGCAFSSALLSQLVPGTAPLAAVQRAKAFVEGALERAPGLGAGRGPMELLWPLQEPAAAGELLP